jgi:hypothetical protein
MGMTGELIGDRWRLVEELEKGRCVTTYLARDEVLGTELEVDAINVETAGLAVDKRRLQEMLDAAMQVVGPHVASLFAWREEDVYIFLMRERVAGTPLTDLLQDMSGLPREQAAEVVEAVADVLGDAYGKGLFYLGLNPGQVMVDKGGEVKVTRVGYSWLLEEMDPIKAARVSTYRAPETDGGKEGTRTSDVYSLAVMIGEMLTRHEVSSRLGSLLERCADPLPSRRPSSPRLLLEALEDSGYKEGDSDVDMEAPAPAGGDKGLSERPAGGLGFIKDGRRSSSAVDLNRRPRGRLLRSLLLVLLGGLMLWVGFAAVSGLIKGEDKEVESASGSGEKARVTLPDLQGLTAEEARDVLEELGLSFSCREAPSRLWSPGRVSAQEPDKGSVLDRGEDVLLVISTGREEELLPEEKAEDEPGPIQSDGEIDQSAAPASSPQQPPPPASPAPAVPAPPLPPRSTPVLSTRGGPAPLYVVMDGSGSYDPDGSIVRFVWDCGDGTVLEGVTAQHVYDPQIIPARYQVVLQVFDSDGLSHSSAVTVEVY